MARHRSSGGRHPLVDPQPDDRFVDDGARHRVSAAPLPVRRGIAVVAVIGGALSVAGAAVLVDRFPAPRDPAADELAVIGLTADGSRAVAAADSSADDSAADGRASDGKATAEKAAADTAVFDTEAVAKAVRKANEEGRRLAEERRKDKDPDARSDSSARAAATPSAPGRTASEFPSELIDTDDWYLTLPTGEEGAPDTVEGSALARFQNRFYKLNDTRDGIVFTAHAGGATTRGSHYPRSELREMNGDEKASWDGRKGTHVMEIDQAITKTPEVKPDVIAGQIHASSDDLMQIHLSGRELTVKYADGKKKVVLDDDYRLGQRFKVRIESSGGHVKVWYDGEQRADLAINSSSSYFKAGAYVNSNTSKGDSASAEGQVVIYDLAVSHT